jgi:flagellar biosynthesis/type III secretory pathway protein FliH
VTSVIKAGQTGPILSQLTTVDLADHLAEARAVVEEARRRAAQIAANAKTQKEQMFEEARQAGFDAGYEQGHEQGTAAGYKAAYGAAEERFNRQHADILADVQRAIAEIDLRKEELRIAAERDLLEFAVLVARKLTFQVGKLHHEAALANLNRSLRLVASQTDLTIRVNPDDLASLETFADSVLQRADASRAVKLVPDDSLKPGGCTVSTDRTDIDATLEAQVDAMVSLLLGGDADDA